MADLITEGNHPAVVNACALTEIESTHEERFNVEFRIVGGDHDGALVRASYGFTSEKQIDLSMSQLRALGWKGTDIANVQLDTVTVFSISVKHDTNPKTGKTYAQALVNTGGLDRFALDANRAKAFAAKLAQTVKAWDATNGKSAPKAAQPPPAAPRAQPPQRTNGAGSAQRPPPGWDGQGAAAEDDIPFIAPLDDIARRWG